MSKVAGSATFTIEKPESSVLIQSAHRTFRQQKDLENYLPTSITLMAVVTDVDRPTYRWSYLNNTAWVDITGATDSSIVITSDMMPANSVAIRVDVQGRNVDNSEIKGQKAFHYIVIEREEYQLGGVEEDLSLIAAITDKFGTTGEGALVNTVIMLLREANSQTVTAGISGLQGHDKNNPAFWAGGTYADALGGSAKAIIRHDGKSKFTDTEITGTINAKNGTIEKLTMAPNGVIELPPTFTSRKGRIDNSGIQLVYDGSNSQRIEWYTGTGTFAGLIAPNSQGHLSISSSFGVGIQSQLINIGTEAFAGKVNIGSGLAEIDFNGSSINNIKEMTNIGYTSMVSLTFIVPNNTSLILRHDTPLSILTSVGSNSFLKSIYMNDNNLLRDGTIKWILNRSASGISIATDGNIRINSGDYTNLQAHSLTPFIYSAGYWYKHSDHR